MFIPFPYTGAHYEEYCIHHHVPTNGPWISFPGPWGGPVPSHYAPPYGPYLPQVGGYTYGGFAAGQVPGLMPPMLGFGGSFGIRDEFGIQRGDWAGPYCGGRLIPFLPSSSSTPPPAPRLPTQQVGTYTSLNSITPGL
ncbi:uncharacterized protein EI97DRAFT_503568 [Westerdykella ornata]|uniref:Uncharacterized protein n=1 Tax=Westerdykella ornata TaxID=318751 RepID=A0A6A6JAD9_WESOR|nr:uncharacterized protein EI97DRAFT_503568 [Westerdykella ornata]KAF2273285.1 hypothetical protein EI97DRAFT_503568 [Westerdykella ornata]